MTGRNRPDRSVIAPRFVEERRSFEGWDWGALWLDELVDTKRKLRYLVIGLAMIAIWCGAVEVVRCWP